MVGNCITQKHVPGRVDGRVGGWMDGCKSRFKDCLQQSKMKWIERDRKWWILIEKVKIYIF